MNEAVVQEIITRKPELKAAKTKLESMQPGNFCIHQSWGFGQIKDFDEADTKLIIDFEDKPGHRMDPGFCVATMQVLPPEHILVRKELAPAEVDNLVANEPTDLIVGLLKQYPGEATTNAEIESVLARVIGPIKFKKWWTATKKLLAKDPRVAVPPRKTGLYVLRDKPVSLEDEIIEEYNSTQSAKRRVALAEKLLDAGADKPEIKEQLAVILHTLATAVKESNQLSDAEKLKGAWIRNDFAKILEVDIEEFTPTLAELVSEISALDALIEEMPTNMQTRTLALIKESHPADWVELTFNLFKASSGKFTTDCVNFFLENDLAKQLQDTLNRWQTEQNLKEPVLLWIVKNRASKKFGELVQDMIQPRLLNSIFFAIDYEALQSASSRRIPLADALSDDKELIPDLLAEADAETARDLANNLLLNQGFEELTKKSLLARFIKLFPGVQSLLDGAQKEVKKEGLIVSRGSYDKAVAEYEEITHKKVPENSRQIAEAREHGDLKENSEYKMAKQDQAVLLGRKSMLEQDLQRAQITDFTEIGLDTVGIGSVVTLTDSTGTDITYTILGAWDSDPENQTISYQTPMGASLLGKKVKDEVVISIGDNENQYTVKAIQRYVDLVKA